METKIWSLAVFQQVRAMGTKEVIVLAKISVKFAIENRIRAKSLSLQRFRMPLKNLFKFTSSEDDPMFSCFMSRPLQTSSMSLWCSSSLERNTPVHDKHDAKNNGHWLQFIQIVQTLVPVKAGGMRIVQHKTPNADRPGKDPVEVIGLSVSMLACSCIVMSHLYCTIGV